MDVSRTKLISKRSGWSLVFKVLCQPAAGYASCIPLDQNSQPLAAVSVELEHHNFYQGIIGCNRVRKMRCCRWIGHLAIAQDISSWRVSDRLFQMVDAKHIRDTTQNFQVNFFSIDGVIWKKDSRCQKVELALPFPMYILLYWNKTTLWLARPPVQPRL